jgi:hypothetical protein
MKKLVLILGVLILTFASCKKEELCTSNCGIIVSDGIDSGCYWLDIQNECSENTKRFCFDENTWSNNFVGDNMCVTNEGSW